MAEGVLPSEWVFNITPKIVCVVQPEQGAVLFSSKRTEDNGILGKERTSQCNTEDSLG